MTTVMFIRVSALIAAGVCLSFLSFVALGAGHWVLCAGCFTGLGVAIWYAVARISIGPPCVATTGRVRYATSASQSDDGRPLPRSCSLLVAVDTRPRESCSIWFEAHPPPHLWPVEGDVLPLLVPVRTPSALGVVWDQAPLSADRDPTGPIGSWYQPGRRRWADPSHVYTDEWPWMVTTADDAVEDLRQSFADNLAARHRAYCRRLAELMLTEPEFLSLKAITRVEPGTILDRATSDLSQVFAITHRAWGALLIRLLMALVVTVLLLRLAGPLLFVIAVCCVQVLLQGGEAVRETQSGWIMAVQDSGLPTADFYCLLACAAVALSAVMRSPVWRVFRQAGAAIGYLERQVRPLLAQRLRAEFHADLNAAYPLLRRRTAPGLAAPLAQQRIERRESAQIRALAFDLGAGAIAISGPRGVGKSTLLAALADPDPAAGESPALTVMVCAPVQYQTRDFVLHLQAKLCEAVLAAVGTRPPRLAWLSDRWHAYAPTGLGALAWVLAISGLSVSVPQALARHAALPRLPGTLLLLSAGCLLLGRRIRQGARPGHHTLVTEVSTRLRQTRFLQTLTAEDQGILRSGWLEFGRRRVRQLVEQPPGLPELIDGYREFAARVARWWQLEHGEGGKLIIGIDEVDRITDPVLAERFVNEIKGIFGSPNCVYVVTISQEALAVFEQRLVRMRTALDSTFDHAVRLDPLSLDESLRLLYLRVNGVPQQFYALCHCLAGGMPRDVLRIARLMFDLHRRNPEPTALDTMVYLLLSHEVALVEQALAAVLPPSVLPVDPPAETLTPCTGVPLFWAVAARAGQQPGQDLEPARYLRHRILAGIGRTATATKLETARSVVAAFLLHHTLLDVFVTHADLVEKWGPKDSPWGAGPNTEDDAALAAPLAGRGADASETAEEGRAGGAGAAPGDQRPDLAAIAAVFVQTHSALSHQPMSAIAVLTDLRSRLNLPVIPIPNLPRRSK